MRILGNFTLIIAGAAMALSACAVGAPLPTSEAKLREATVAAIQGVDRPQIVITDDRPAARQDLVARPPQARKRTPAIQTIPIACHRAHPKPDPLNTEFRCRS